MTSAEREARAKARLAWGRDDANPLNAFDAGWSAGAEYARGATVAEIVEALEVEYKRTGDEHIGHFIDFIEARFSPAAPPEREDTR